MNIHNYASQGDCVGVRKELKQGVPVDVRNGGGYTPLALAAGSPHANEEMLTLLLDAGADINAFVEEANQVPLGLAACAGSLDKVRCLIDAGANVNFAFPKGYTILIKVMYALNSDDRLVPLADLLVRNGANIVGRTDYGETALFVVAISGRFDAVKLLLDAGVDPMELAWTPLMHAVALGSCDDVERILATTSKIDDRDFCRRTPWLLVALVGDPDKAKLLLLKGANIEDRGRMGDTALMIASSNAKTAMVRWLLHNGADVNAEDDSGHTALMFASQAGATECVQLLLEAGANASRKNEFQQSAMTMAANEPIMRLLIATGEPIGDASTELKRTLLGLPHGNDLEISQSEYLSGRYRRFGRSNPEVMDIAYWKEMVRSGTSAYQARVQFGDTGNFAEPVWCFSRFGMSLTELPDGRFVQIGGEHEDFYDPDFCIYNEVIIHERSGNFQIMGYPTEVFPPTDFHSATYHDGSIYIVGSLGYQGARKFATTPVYRLDCQTWRISAVATSGENPGWLYDHRASVQAANVLAVWGGKVCQANAETEQELEDRNTYNLDLSNNKWTRVAQSNAVADT